jgi:Ca2+-binding RTX toxin-like protein
MAGLLTAFLAVGPASATAAGTVVYFDNTLFGGATRDVTFNAGAGDTNNVRLTGNDAQITITDTGANVSLDPISDPGCNQVNPSTITCAGPGFSPIQVFLGNGNDSFQNDAAVPTSVHGEDGLDMLTGGPLNDLLNGSTQGGLIGVEDDADIIDGGAGDDTLFGGSGDLDADAVEGGPGDDRFALDPNDGNDTLRGGPGIDHVRGFSAGPFAGQLFSLGDGLPNDGFAGSNPPQTANLIDIEDATTGEARDTVTGTSGPNILVTFDENDTIDGLQGADTIDAGTHDDLIESRDGYRDRIRCGPGTDTARADQLDVLSGCENTTRSFVAPVGTGPITHGPDPPPPAPPTLAGCPPNKNVMVLTAASEVRNGTAAPDLIFAGEGNDVIDALAGDDCVDLAGGNDRGQGGAGDDFLLGGPGDDVVSGSVGNDRVSGDAGRDRVTGASGNDVVAGGTGADNLLGGLGDDRLSGDASGDRMSGSRGRDRVRGGSGNDVLSGGSSPDSVSGEAGNDRINGNSSRDSLSGGSGNDRISARDRQRDRISCGPGTDRVSADPADRVARDCERVSRR